MLFEEVYDCIYSAKGKTGKEQISVPLGHYVCFSSIYSKIQKTCYSEITYKIYLYKDNLSYRNFNLCSRLETKKVLRCLQKVVPFDYKFTSSKYTEGRFSRELTEFHVLVITIKGTYTQHLWVTTMLRCFFEYPYNVAAKEACELQRKEQLVNDSWLNLYYTIVALLGSGIGHGVVTFERQPLPKTYADWKKQIANMPQDKPVYLQICKHEPSYGIKNFYIEGQATLDQGVETRAEKYLAAYKDKLSWKK